MRLDDFVRVNHVAERLRHGAALGVEHPAVGQNLPVRRRAVRDQSQQQRAVKPPTVLVAAFEVNVGRPGDVRPVAEHCGVTRPGIEPHVQDVRFLAQFRVAALGTLRSPRQEILSRVRVPGVGAFLLEKLDRFLCQPHSELWRIDQRLLANVAVECGDRDAPDALAGNAPVGPRGDHV